MSSAPRISSEVGAAAAAAAPRLPRQAAGEQADAQPFAVLLDANESPPATAKTPAATLAASLQSEQQTSATANGAGAKSGANATALAILNATGKSNGAGGGKSSAVRGTGAASIPRRERASLMAGVSASPDATSDPQANAAADNGPANVAPANAPNTAGTPPDGSRADRADVKQSVALDIPPTTSCTPPPPDADSEKASSGKNDDKDDLNKAVMAVPAASQSQPAANLLQPVTTTAAVLGAVPGAVLDAGPDAASSEPAAGVAANTAIDGQGKSAGNSLTKFDLPLGGKPNASPQNAAAQNATPQNARDNEAPASLQTASQLTPGNEASAANAANAGSSRAGNTPPTGADPQQPAQTQVDGNAGAPPPGALATQGGANRAAPLTGIIAAATGAGQAAGQGAGLGATAATDANGMPNFGFVAANAGAAAAGSSAAASADATPLAGLAVAIAARAQAGAHQFDIRLDPPELGRIDVRLDVDRNGQVTSHVTVERADTLQLLQSQQPQLERALEQAGLKTADNGLQFTLRDQSFAGQNGNGGSAGQHHVAQLVVPDAEPAPVNNAPIYSRVGLRGGVDIRV